MSLDEHLIFVLSEARKVQLSSVQNKYRQIVSEILRKDVEDIVLTDLGKPS